MASRSGTSATPSTWMPYCDEAVAFGRRGACARTQVLDGGRLLDRGLALLEPLHDLVDDDLRRDLRAAERDVEVVGLLKPISRMTSASSAEPVIFCAGRPAFLRCSCSSSRPVCSESSRDSALNQALDLVARAGGLDDGEPVARRPALALGGEHLDDVAGLQLVVQRDDLAVDLRARRSGGRRRCGPRRRSRAASRPAASDLTSPFGVKTKTSSSTSSPFSESANSFGSVDVGLPVEQRLEPLQLGVGRVRSARCAVPSL